MLHLFEQNNLYLSSLMLFVPGRELYIQQVKFWSTWNRLSENSHSTPKRSNISWKDLCSLTIRSASILPRPAKALTVSQPVVFHTWKLLKTEISTQWWHTKNKDICIFWYHNQCTVIRSGCMREMKEGALKPTKGFFFGYFLTRPGNLLQHMFLA